MTTPEPVASIGAALLQGRATSGRRMVENTLTTALSASRAIAGLGSATAFGLAAAVPSVPASSQPQKTKRSVGVIKSDPFPALVGRGDSDTEAQACRCRGAAARMALVRRAAALPDPDRAVNERCSDGPARQGDADARPAPVRVSRHCQLRELEAGGSP